jgi:YggT family protein
MAREGLLIILGPLIKVALIAIKFYIYVVVAWVIMSWLVNFNVVNRSNRLVYAIGDILHRLTEPALKRIRPYMPNLGAIDLTPMALILILIFVQLVLGNILYSLPQPAL